MTTDIFIFAAAYIIGVILTRAGFLLLSGASLIIAAVFLYFREYHRSGMLLNLRGFLALGLIGGEGIACFKLSRLSTIWTWETWLSFYLMYLVFYITSTLMERYLHKRKDGGVLPEQVNRSHEHMAQNALLHADSIRFYKHCILCLVVITWVCFFIEAYKLGFIPFFTKDMPHAYSYFHLRGIHYFTTLVILIPSISILAIEEQQHADLISSAGIFFSLLLTILLVSRFQFLFSVILMVFTLMLGGRRLKPWQVLTLSVLMVLVYVMITIARAHSVTYLNEIFEMKNPATPIFITQPYMYIANNYDNFNVMTEHLSEHTYGMKMLYPLVTLSGIKYFIPMQLAFPLYTTKAELTTLTLIYDAYYDFGIWGVMLLGGVLGLCSGCITQEIHHDRNPFSRIIFAQLAFYLLFSFFTTWFSNAATWFYLGCSVCLYLLFQIRILIRRK